MSSGKVNDSEIGFELKSSFINTPSLEFDYRFVIQPETENKEESTHYVIWEDHVFLAKQRLQAGNSRDC